MNPNISLLLLNDIVLLSFWNWVHVNPAVLRTTERLAPSWVGCWLCGLCSRELFQFFSLNIQIFTEVRLSSCTKPHCLSCSRTCEIFRFSSSTFKFIFNLVFYIVNVACTPRECFCSWLIYFSWNHPHGDWPGSYQLSGRCCETYTVINKNHIVWAVRSNRPKISGK